MPLNTQTPGRFRRVLRIVKTTLRIGKWLIVLALIAAVVYVVWTNHRGRVVAADTLKALHARGVPPDTTPDVDDDTNAARYYRAAGELLHLPEDMRDQSPVIGYADWPKFGEGFTPDQAAVLHKMVGINRLGLEAVRQVKPNDPVRFELDLLDDFQGTMNILGNARLIARWYQIDALAATAEGDTDRAVENCVSAFRLSRAMAGDDYLIVALIRISIAALAESVAEDLLGRAVLTDAQFTRLRNDIRLTRNSFDLAKTIRHEWAYAAVGLHDPDWQIMQGLIMQRHVADAWLPIIEALAGDEIDEDDLWELTTWEWLQQASLRTFYAWCPGHVRLQTANTLREQFAFYDELVDPATTSARLVELSGLKTGNRDLAPLQAALRTHLQLTARLDAAAAAIDVERFRLREERWPASLTEVYKDIPKCAYGHELRMIIDGTQCRVYSLGANGIDDRGIDPWSDAKVTGDEDDFAFVLLEPSQRSRPATTQLEGEPPPPISEAFDALQESIETLESLNEEP